MFAPGIHDDIVIALALATWTPGRFNPNAKVAPRTAPPPAGPAAEAAAGGVGGWVKML